MRLCVLLVVKTVHNESDYSVNFMLSPFLGMGHYGRLCGFSDRR